MAEVRGKTLHTSQATEEVAGQLFARSIEGVSEANCREIKDGGRNWD